MENICGEGVILENFGQCNYRIAMLNEDGTGIHLSPPLRLKLLIKKQGDERLHFVRRILHDVVDMI